MSDVLDKTCATLSSVLDEAMQGIQDMANSTANFIGPVLKGFVDAAVGILPGGASAKKDDCCCNKQKGGKGVVASSGPGGPQGTILQLNRHIIRVAGISGALAVGLGAYGAHVIMVNDKIPENQKHSFKTANMYHFIGTFGLVASSLSSYPRASGFLMGVGTALFCGSCYYYGFTGDQKLNKFAPYGGSTLIIAWLSLVL